MADKDVESGKPQQINHFKQVFDQAGVTSRVEEYDYDGSGTDDDPYVVAWIDNDPRNPMLYSQPKKWFLTMVVAIATLAVAFVSSAYSGGANQIIREFGCSQEIYTLGISFFVLGFAIGPLLWAPLSEIFGRQVLYAITYGFLTAFNAGAAGSNNIATLIVLRFFAGAFGSSPLTNAGGVIADMFPARERGLAMSLFAAAPFMGPVLGPIVGGFVGETIGWRWVEGVMAIFTGVLWIIGMFVIPETYPPVIQRQRAKKLSKMTGKVYRSRADVDQGPTTLGHVMKTSLSRPWVLLFREPIVFLLSIYMAIIYGTLYMLFSAFPIVYQQNRGWSPGIGGLAFLGVAVGMILAVIFSIWENTRYAKVSDEYNGFAPPETRLTICIVGGVSIPIGLFWFAWTNYPSIHWMASIAAGVPFGFGMVLVFLGIMNYLIDAYTIFAASVLAANAVLRSLFGAAFPLFTTQMYNNLGKYPIILTLPRTDKANTRQVSTGLPPSLPSWLWLVFPFLSCSTSSDPRFVSTASTPKRPPTSCKRCKPSRRAAATTRTRKKMRRTTAKINRETLQTPTPQPSPTKSGPTGGKKGRKNARRKNRKPSTCPMRLSPKAAGSKGYAPTAQGGLVCRARRATSTILLTWTVLTHASPSGARGAIAMLVACHGRVRK